MITELIDGKRDDSCTRMQCVCGTISLLLQTLPDGYGPRQTKIVDEMQKMLEAARSNAQDYIIERKINAV